MVIKNIIFDWSGTLSDDFTPVHEASARVIKSLINKDISKEEFRREFVMPYMNFWNKYIPDLTKEKCNELYSEEYSKVSDPKPYDGVGKILNLLKEKGYNMLILSSHPTEKLIPEAKKYGFFEYFKEINGSVHDKSIVIKEIMKRNNLKTNETLYMGDMTHDIISGKKAGITTVAIGWGYQNKEKLLAEDPDYYIDNIEDFTNLL